MKKRSAAIGLILAAFLMRSASAQDVGARPSIDQKRDAFHKAIELCVQSVQALKHFEDLPEAQGVLGKTPVARPAPPPGTAPKPPAFHKPWYMLGHSHVGLGQEEHSCSVSWIAKPYGATQADDLTNEMEPTIAHILALLPSATELPFYPSQNTTHGRRFVVNDNVRMTPFYVSFMDYGGIVIGINELPYLASVLNVPFRGFENTCLRPYYAGRKVTPSPSDLKRPDASLQAESGFIFYGNPEYGRHGFDPDQPNTCAYHVPAVSLEDAQRVLSPGQWGMPISVSKASKGGVILVVQAP